MAKTNNILKSSGNIATTLNIGGMGCTACAVSVEQALKAVPGVQDAAVNLATRQARVTYAPAQVTPESLAQAITAAGYSYEGLVLE